MVLKRLYNFYSWRYHSTKIYKNLIFWRILKWLINAKNQKIIYLSVWQKFLPRLGTLIPKIFRLTSKLSNETRFVFLSCLDQKLCCKTETTPVWRLIAVKYLMSPPQVSSLNYWALHQNHWFSKQTLQGATTASVCRILDREEALESFNAER